MIQIPYSLSEDQKLSLHLYFSLKVKFTRISNLLYFIFKFHVCTQVLNIDDSLQFFQKKKYSEINKAPNKWEDQNIILPLEFLVGQFLDVCIYSFEDILTELVKML